jgi:hypothetical protein
MVVLCMSGGGMKAITWLIAIFVSFLWDTEHEDIQTGQDVLRSVTLLSTVSASSWFVMSLLYSEVFGGFLEDMGKTDTPGEARDIFMKRWVAPLRELLRRRGLCGYTRTVSPRHRFMFGTMKHTVGRDAAHLAMALSGDITWTRLLLEAIQSNAPMLPPVVAPTPLAANLRWLVNSTLHLPLRSKDTPLTEHRSYRGQADSPYPGVPFTACIGVGGSRYQCVQAEPLGPYETVTYFEDNKPVAVGSLVALGGDRGLVSWDDLSTIQRLVAASCHLSPLVDRIQAGPWVKNANPLNLCIGPSFLEIVGVSDRKRKRDFECNPVGLSDGVFSDNSGVGAALRISKSPSVVLLAFDAATVDNLFVEPLPVFAELPSGIASFLRTEDRREGTVREGGVTCERALYAGFGDRGMDRYGRPTPAGSNVDILERIERLRFRGLSTSQTHAWFGMPSEDHISLTIFRFHNKVELWSGVARETKLGMSGNLDDYGFVLERGLGFLSHCATLRRDVYEALVGGE